MTAEIFSIPEWFHQLGLMGLPLALCSLLAMTLCLERIVFFSKSFFSQEQCYQKIADSLETYKAHPKQVRDEVISLAFNKLQVSYYRGIKGLRTIGTISPMLGLLGTILGMIQSFEAIALQAGPVPPSVIADGLWEAMLTTKVGLFIAIPAFVLAYCFQHISQTQLNDFFVRLHQLSLSFDLALDLDGHADCSTTTKPTSLS